MNLKQIGSNMTEMTLGENRILISYQTPVAAMGPKLGTLRTSKKWSSTTTRHINKWLCGYIAREMGQEYFDALLSEVK